MDCLQLTFGILTAFLFFIVAVAGAILPALPSAPFALIGMLFYGLIVNFDQFDTLFISVQIVLALLTLLMDYVANALGVKALGGSKAGMFGAFAGLFLGMFAGPFGLVFGPVLGAAGVELLTGKKTFHAVRSGIGGFIGLLLGTISKLFLLGIMVAWFLYRITPQIASCINWI